MTTSRRAKAFTAALAVSIGTGGIPSRMEAGTSVGIAPPESPSGDPPNIVFVTSDDQRWDALGAAGNPAVVTPVLDRMAADGVYFRQAIVSVSQCHPVRASLLTGVPAFRHGVYSVHYQAAGVEQTVCRRSTVSGILRSHGYHTALIGKWHIPGDPWDCGFDEVRTWLPGGSAEFRDAELATGRSRQLESVPGYTQQVFVDDAVAFLRQQAKAERPFFLWLALTAPHYPYEPNPPDVEALYADRLEDELLPPGFPRGIPTNDWRHYNEAVSYLDQQLGRLLDALNETSLDDHTVVVFMADNGYMMGEHGVGATGSRANGKVVPYESSLRVPMLLLGPGLPGATGPSDLPVSSLDLSPTMLALAGLPAPPDWPGRDLLAVLAGRIEINEAFAEWSDEQSEKFGHLAYRVVRTPRYKLIHWKDPGRGDQLYDLLADPTEVHDLSSDPEAKAVGADLRQRLGTWMERTQDPARDWPRE